MAKIRLDQELLNRQLVETKSKAQSLILLGKVKVNQKPILKAGFFVPPHAIIEIEEEFLYVSRGALKLLKAFEEFPLNAQNKTAIDIGSSTGGFTQVLLEKGASKVYAVDSGTNQLHYKLRTHKKVEVLEKTNARYLTKAQFNPLPLLAVIDVSFISLSLILPVVKNLQCAEVVALIKPQFEMGKEIKNFNGVVKTQEDRDKAIEKVKNYAIQNNFKVKGVVESPITGPKGNQEYLIYLSLILP